MNKHKNYIYIYKSNQAQFSKKIDKELTKKKVAFGVYIAIAALVAFAFMIFYLKQEPWVWQVEEIPDRTIYDMKYFTLLSNLFMGIMAIIMFSILAQNIWGKRKTIHKGFLIADLVMTASVTVTMLTAVFFLLPVALANSDNLKLTASQMIGGSQLFFHILIPTISIIAFISFVNTQQIKLVETLYVLIPVVVYSIFYMCVALTHIDPETHIPPIEYDWYFFCQAGLQYVPIVVIMMYGLCFFSGWILWLLNRKVKTQMVHFEYFFNILVVLMGVGGTIWLVYIKGPGNYWYLLWLTSWSVWITTLCSFVYLFFMALRSSNVIKEIPSTMYAIKIACVATVLFNGAFEILFNWPIKEGPKCFDGQNHIFHLLVPIISTISYILVERGQKVTLKQICYSMIPYFAYFSFYWIYNYIHMDGPWHWPEGDWDWYKVLGATKWGSVPICFVGSCGLGYFMGWLLWIWNRKIHIGLPKAPLLFQRKKALRK